MHFSIHLMLNIRELQVVEQVEELRELDVELKHP